MGQRRLPGGFNTFSEAEADEYEVRRTVGIERITGSDRRIDLNLDITLDLRRGCLSWVWMILVGGVFVVLSLPEGTAALTSRPGWGWLGWAADASAAVNAVLPPFPVLLTTLVAATGVFALAVFVLGFRHGSPRLGWTGVFALLVAALSLPAVAWVGAGVRWATSGIGHWVAGWTWPVWVIATVAGIGLIVLVTVVDVPAVIRWIAVLVMNLLWLAVLLLVPIWLLWSGIPLLRILVVLLLLEVLGRLLVDQFLGTAKAGRGRRGVLMGAIGVGTSWAMLMLTGDVWGSHDLYPAQAREVIDTWLVSNNPPQFDALVSVLVVAGSAVATVANIRRLRPEPTPDEFARSILFTLCGMVFAATVAAISHRTETGSTTARSP